jgi:chemotaxis protein CheC
MINISELSGVQLDFFRELENIGAGHAATALSAMLNQPVNINVPTAQFCEFNQMCDLLNGPETLIVGQLIEISGDMNGFIMMVQKEEDARYLASKLIGEIEEANTSGEYSELMLSALQEICNILTGSYLTAISLLTGFTIQASVPSMVIDMAGAVMNLPAVAYGHTGDIVLFLETEYCDQDRKITGHFFLIPDADSYKRLFEVMGIS